MDKEKLVKKQICKEPQESELWSDEVCGLFGSCKKCPFNMTAWFEKK